jgi:hypothetical protein
MKEFQIIVHGTHNEDNATGFRDMVDNFVRAIASRGYQHSMLIADWDCDDIAQGKPVEEAGTVPEPATTTDTGILSLKVPDARKAIATLDDLTDLADLLEAEQAQGNRRGVIDAITARVDVLLEPGVAQ